MEKCDSYQKECPSHFKNLRPSLSGYKVSRHLEKDLNNHQSMIDKILECENVCFSELHKFEEKIDDLSIFRAKIDSTHIVYAVSKEKMLFFLRAFKNFSSYSKFLADKRAIKKMVESMTNSSK